MKAPSSITRGEEPFVPPEDVMTRLMRRPGPSTGNSWVGYVLLVIFMAGVLAGLALAAGG